MNILLTNDDGYLAEGLMLLCEKLSENNNVYVVAPESQRSGFSHATSFRNELNFTQINNYCGAKICYISSGTPADCVIFGCTQLGVKFDLLVSGPNNGDNCAMNTIYSGTIGAAEEGVMNGVRSIALSRVNQGVPFYSAIEFFCNNLEKFVSIKFDKYSYLNVNIPLLPLNEIKGVKIAHAGWKEFVENYKRLPNSGLYKMDSRFISSSELEPDCDRAVADDGYVVVTPLTVDPTNYAMFDELKGLFE